jgi:hypothetical protein
MGEYLCLESFFDDQSCGEAYRGSARDGEIIDCAVYRQLPDGPAGEHEGAHYEGVGGQGDAGVAEGERRRVGKRGEGRVFEDRKEQALDELMGRLASGAVAHVYARGCELRGASAVLFQRVEYSLLSLAHGLVPISTFSYDLRPKL